MANQEELSFARVELQLVESIYFNIESRQHFKLFSELAESAEEKDI